MPECRVSSAAITSTSENVERAQSDVAEISDWRRDDVKHWAIVLNSRELAPKKSI